MSHYVRCQRSWLSGLALLSMLLLSVLHGGCRGGAPVVAREVVLPAEVAALAGSDEHRRVVLIGRDGQVKSKIAVTAGLSMAWSPDGKTLAFNGAAGERTGDGERIWLADLWDDEFVNVRALPSPPSSAEGSSGAHGGMCPSWSPDGKQIAFDFETRIWTYDFEEDELYRVTPNPLVFDVNCADQPVWSPTGEWIAFRGTWSIPADDGPNLLQSDIFVVHPDGTRRTRIIIEDHSVLAMYPNWSPDGHRLAFAAYLPKPVSKLVIFDVATGGVRMMTDAICAYPSWSPDGQVIAVSSKVAKGLYQTSLVDPATGEMTKLTSYGENERDTAWSPDGNWLALSRQAGGHWRVVFHSLETHEEIIVEGPRGQDLRNPVWRPSPSGLR